MTALGFYMLPILAPFVLVPVAVVGAMIIETRKRYVHR